MRTQIKVFPIIQLVLAVSACFLFSACGVKGKPLPPLKPAPLSDPNNRKVEDKPTTDSQTRKANDQSH
ncbi:MAG: hypothetical protein V4736_05795 [Bdellovibrionota bacterium]